MKQSTNQLLMIRPVSFGQNKETQLDNVFQKNLNASKIEIQRLALKEFDDLVNKIRACQIDVLVVDDTHLPATPDSIFPNNWISLHENGQVGMYPMLALNRRGERREDILERLEANGYYIDQVIDYSIAEEEDVYLEGTGAFVLDRENEIAYCGLSERADEDLFIEFCEDFGFFPVVFNTVSSLNKQPVYHTNVVMSVASTFAVICLDVISSKSEKKEILNHLKRFGKHVITISEDQMNNFCGNVLEVRNDEDELFLVMSTLAYNTFTNDQKSILLKTHKIIHSNLETIETIGGGSARCMIAEQFLSK